MTVPGVFNVKIFSITDSGRRFKQIATIDDSEFALKRTSSPEIFYVRSRGILITGRW